MAASDSDQLLFKYPYANQQMLPNHFSFGNIQCSCHFASTKGDCLSSEDFFSVKKSDTFAFVGVFDSVGGTTAGKYCKDNLSSIIQEMPQFQKYLKNSEAHEKIIKAFNRGFEK